MGGLSALVFQGFSKGGQAAHGTQRLLCPLLVDIPPRLPFSAGCGKLNGFGILRPTCLCSR